MGATDACELDLEIMNSAGDRFLDQRGVRWAGGPYQMTVPVEMRAERSPEPSQDEPAAPQMEMTM